MSRLLLLLASLCVVLSAEEKGRITGIGGVFFKSAENKRLYEWYDQKLGLPNFKNQAILLGGGKSVIGIFSATSRYFEGPMMINYTVDDLDAYLEKLKAKGVRIDPKQQDSAEGRFAWIYDADGTKIELWQPPSGVRPQNGPRGQDSVKP